MAGELPDWFIEKYSARTPTPVLQRTEPRPRLLPIPLRDPEDTQQERERLQGSVLESTRKRIDPEILDHFKNKYTFDPEGADYDYKSAEEAGLSPDETGHWPSRVPETGLLLKGRKHETWNKTLEGEKKLGYKIYKKNGRYYSEKGQKDFLNISLLEPQTKPIEGQKIFTDQNEWEKIIAEAPEEGRIVSFKTAFDKARAAGLREFEYKGDLFNTRKKGETDNQWLSNIKINRSADAQKISKTFKEAFEEARNLGLRDFKYQNQLYTTRKKGENEATWMANIRHRRDPFNAPGRILAYNIMSRVLDDEATKTMIKESEGIQLKVYRDPANLHPTIGYGHRIKKGEKFTELTKEEAEQLFEKDYITHKKAAEKVPGYKKADKVRKSVIVDLTYNMGPSWYKRFPKFTKAFAAGDYNKAADELINSKLYKQIPARTAQNIEMIRQGFQGRG